MKRNGFTLTELVVATAILSIFFLFLVGIILFSSKKVKEEQETLFYQHRLKVSLTVLNQDLMKAGYDFDKSKDKCNGHSDFIYWDGKELDVCYVDYDEKGCEDKPFQEGDPCSYLVKYVKEPDGLKRCINVGANSTDECGYLLKNDDRLKVEDFNVSIQPDDLIEYDLKVNYKGSNQEFKGAILNGNGG